MKFRRILTAPMTLILCAGLLAFVLIFAIVTRPASPEISASHVASTGQIRLTWDPVPGAKAYRVYRAGETEDDHRFLEKTTLSEFTDTEAEMGTGYRYYVRAISSLFFPSGPSAEVFSHPLLPQPAVRISGVDATGQTRLQWKAIEGADHYRLYRSENGSNWELLDSTRKTDFTDNLAQVGVNYAYRILAVSPDPTSSSAYSEVCSRVCALPCPEVSLDNDPDSGRLVLKWEPVAEARGYEILRAEGSAGSFRSTAVTEEPFFADPEGIPLNRYRYQVVALSSRDGADSARSAEVRGIPDLARPQVILGCDAPTGHVALSWAPVEGAAEYRIYWSEQEEGDYELLTATRQETFVDTSGAIGESYFYRVLAAAAEPEGNSAFSAIQKGTFALPCPLVTGTNDAATGHVQLTWEPVSGASRYEVYRADAADGIPEYLGSTRSAPFTDHSGTPKAHFFYTVVAISPDPNANSAPSAPLDKAFALPSPVITVSNHADNGRVKISWKEVEGAVGYEVYRADTADGDYEFLTDSDNTVCLDTTGAVEEPYHYKVLALAEDEAVNSGLSASRSGTYHYLSKLILTAEVNGSGKPKLEWNEVENGVKYQLYRSMLPDSEFSQIANFRGVEFTNSNALTGVPYYYRVKALNEKGDVVKTSNTVFVQCPMTRSESFKTRYVDVPKAWLYAAPTVDAATTPVRYMDKIRLGEDVISNSVSTWYRVKFDDKLYYMRIEKDADVLTSKKRKFQYEGQTKRQQQIIDLALEISEEWKTTYAHDQSNGVPNKKGVYGFDCTGLVKYIFGTVMQKTVPSYRLYASIDTLYKTKSIYNQGYPGEFFATTVKRKDIQPGDVLFFTSQADGSDSDRIGHCGIYLGNNEFVHATSAWEDAVCIVPLAGSFEENLVAIRRYLPKTVTPANTKVRLKNTGTHYLYTDRTRKSSVVTAVTSGGTVTVLFTDNADWAWVRADNGKEGFILVENFK